MNHWEILIIPLIAFGAWILSVLFKEDEANKSKGPQRRLDGARTRAARRPAPVLDKFLDEAGRRRDMPEGMESHPGRQEPPKPVAPQRRPVPTPRRQQAPILATIIEEPQRTIIRQAVVAERSPESLFAPIPIAMAEAPPAMLLTKNERRASAVLQEVMRLLRSSKTAGVALVLREILDRPVALRRRT